jgi:hypothetical protein
MARVVLRMVAAVLGAVAGFYLSIQVQLALIEAGVIGDLDRPCNDVVIRPRLPSPSCLGPRPMWLPVVLAIVGGAALGWWLLGSARRRARTKDAPAD